MAAQPKSEAELIRALSEDLALEILASYPAEDFAEADFTSLGEAAVYLAQQEPGVGPALQDLIAKVPKRRGHEDGAGHSRGQRRRMRLSAGAAGTMNPCTASAAMIALMIRMKRSFSSWVICLPRAGRSSRTWPVIRTPAEGVGRDSRRLGLRID